MYAQLAPSVTSIRLERLYATASHGVPRRISLRLTATGMATSAAMLGPRRTIAATVSGKPNEIVAFASSRSKFSDSPIASASTTNAAVACGG